MQAGNFTDCLTDYFLLIRELPSKRVYRKQVILQEVWAGACPLNLRNIKFSGKK